LLRVVVEPQKRGDARKLSQALIEALPFRGGATLVTAWGRSTASASACMSLRCENRRDGGLAQAGKFLRS
jgi:hypothetical protein